jgi:hypothetical protein
LGFENTVSHAEVSMRVLSSLAVVLVLLFFLPPPSSGQVSLGFQGGLSLAKITEDNPSLSEEWEYQEGVAVGAFLDIPVSDMVILQPGLNYVQKGASASGQEDGGSYETELDLGIIEIPLLLKINIPTDGRVTPHLLVGPAIGFKTGCEISWSFRFQGESESDTEDCDDETKSIDFGGMFGAGVGITAGPGEVVLGARYNLGLITVDDPPAGEEEMDVKTRAFSFLAGYSFPVGG